MFDFSKILYIILFLIPFSFALNIHRDVDMAFLRPIIFLFFLSFAVYLFLRNESMSLDKFKNKQSYFFISFFLWSFFSSFWALNPVWGVRKSIFFATLIPLYFLVIYILDSRERLKKASKAFIYGGFISALFGVLQFLSQFVFNLSDIYNFWAYKVSMLLYGQNFGTVVIQNQSWFVNIGGNDFFRAISFFPDPHTFALYLGILIPFTVGFFFYENKKDKAFFITILSVMFLALLFTFSRGAYIGFFLSTLFVSVFYFSQLKVFSFKKSFLSLFLLVLAFIIVFLNTVFGERFLSSFSLEDVSNSGRVAIWQETVLIGVEHPILGVGLGNLPVFIDPVASVKSPINAHNTYLDIFSELGLVGFFLFFGLIFYSFSFLSFKKDKLNFLRAGILWSLSWFLIHSFFETSIFSVSVFSAFCFMLALVVVLRKMVKGSRIG